MAIPPYKAPARSSYDIVIVGGAVVGSYSAYWLSLALGKDASVLVVERDSTFEFSSTALSTSAIRQQYSNPINVKISQFGIEMIRSFPERMGFAFPGEPPPELGFREHGYLYCVSPEGVDAAKIERWHQTLKNRILLENYFLPGDLERQIEAFVEHYNHRRLSMTEESGPCIFA